MKGPPGDIGPRGERVYRIRSRFMFVESIFTFYKGEEGARGPEGPIGIKGSMVSVFFLST